MEFKKLKNIDPVSFFQRLSNKEKNVCFLHTADKKGKSILAWDPIESFIYKNGEREDFTKDFRKFTDRNIRMGREIIGYFSYDLAYELLNVKKTAKDDLKLPDIYFYAFENRIVFKNGNSKIYYSGKNFPKICEEINNRKIIQIKGGKNIDRKKNFRPILARNTYDSAYKKIKSYIKEGDVYQINLTHRLEVSTDIPARKLFLKVIEKNPVEFLAYIEGDGFEILSASPERFVKIEKRKIETCPIKGTRPRGKNKAEDEKFKKELMKSEKEAKELNMITDLLRNDLGKVCEIGSVEVVEDRIIQKCPTVWHTYSKITGNIKRSLSPVEAIISMLPGGSITGCPKKRAVEIIDELERKTRGIYTGIIGYIENSKLDFNIAIRTIIKKKNKLYLQVGGGIVLDSENQMEYEETLHKVSSFMKILC